MKALLLKAGQNYQVVDIAKDHDYTDLKKLIEIENPITCVTRKVDGKHYDIWLDDEGLLKDGDIFANGLCMNGYEVLVGNLLIVKGADKDGNIVGLTTKDIKHLTSKKSMIDINELMQFKGYEKDAFLVTENIKVIKNGKLLTYSV